MAALKVSLILPMEGYLLLSRVGGVKPRYMDGYGAITYGPTLALKEKMTFNLQALQRPKVVMFLFSPGNFR